MDGFELLLACMFCVGAACAYVWGRTVAFDELLDARRALVVEQSASDSARAAEAVDRAALLEELRRARTLNTDLSQRAEDLQAVLDMQCLPLPRVTQADLDEKLEVVRGRRRAIAALRSVPTGQA